MDLSKFGSSFLRTAAPLKRCYDDPTQCAQFVSVEVSPPLERMKLCYSVGYATGFLGISVTVPGALLPRSPKQLKRLAPFHVDILGNGVNINEVYVDEFKYYLSSEFDDPVEVSLRGNLSLNSLSVRQEATTITFHDCPTNEIVLWTTALVTVDANCTLTFAMDSAYVRLLYDTINVVLDDYFYEFNLQTPSFALNITLFAQHTVSRKAGTASDRPAVLASGQSFSAVFMGKAIALSPGHTSGLLTCQLTPSGCRVSFR